MDTEGSRPDHTEISLLDSSALFNYFAPTKSALNGAVNQGRIPMLQALTGHVSYHTPIIGAPSQTQPIPSAPPGPSTLPDGLSLKRTQWEPAPHPQRGSFYGTECAIASSDNDGLAHRQLYDDPQRNETRILQTEQSLGFQNPVVGDYGDLAADYCEDQVEYTRLAI